MSKLVPCLLVIMAVTLLVPASCSKEPAQPFLKSAPGLIVNTENTTANLPLHVVAQVEPREDLEVEDLAFSWTISNQAGEAVHSEAGVAQFDWIPQTPGTYLVNCVVSYMEESEAGDLVIAVIDRRSLLLEQYRKNIVGTWTGVAAYPWIDPCNVEVTFRDNGAYSARNLSGDPLRPAFYYGTDDDSESKAYSLEDVGADGRASGHIVIYFGGGPGNTNTDDLVNIEFSDNCQSLRFDFYHRVTYGPVSFSLHRSGP